MQRKVPLCEGEFYHIYNRGNDKRNIFLDTSDYRRFVALLYLCNSILSVDIGKFREGLTFTEGQTFANFLEIFSVEREETLVDIGAHCPMPNHFHLLLHEHTEGGISKFMQKLSTAYVMYFNTKHKRTGGLFEGSFKSRHVDNDGYFAYLFAYIPLNSVKLIEPKWKEDGIIDMVKVKKYLRNYKYSSYLDYLGEKRPENMILNRNVFPEYFKDVASFEDFIEGWLNYKDNF